MKPQATLPAAQVDPACRLEPGLWSAVEANRHRAVLLRDPASRLLLLAARPCDVYLLQMLEARLGEPLRWLQAPPGELARWLQQAEAGSRALDGLGTAGLAAAGPGEPEAAHAGLQEISLAGLGQAASPAVRLLDALLLDALHDGASDIHIERRTRGAQVRVRLDGVMQPLREIDEGALAEAIVSRLKVMAELDIGERRVPQDGRFRLAVRGREIDFRLSIMPTVHGEDAVVRVLDRSALLGDGRQITLASLGYPPALAASVLAQARAPHGLMLVTGPTGSGKTTTLYAALGAIDHTREKLVTIEDPVEYDLPAAAQVQVNDRQGLGFARGLRSILRHDPDRVLVGEIRDGETAQIAVQAALTGHLVLSTVHANHALDVLGRFTHMGIDLYNLVSALNAVVAQRLVRRLCEACAEPVPTAATTAPAASHNLPAPRLRRAVGCPACRDSGYRGRMAVAELLLLNDELRELVVARAPMSRLRAAAQAAGLQGLQQAAQAAVSAGHTTQEELERVIGST